MRWTTTRVMVAGALLAISVAVVGTGGAGAGDLDAAIANGEPVAADGSVPQVLDRASGALCTGVFVSEAWVLTAAHCVEDVPTGRPSAASDLEVYLDGDRDGFLPFFDDPLDADLRIDVLRVERHPTRDLAVLQLARPVSFPDGLLPLAATDVEPDVRGDIVPVVGVGWGDDRAFDTDNSFLHAGGFGTVPTSTCEIATGPLDPDLFCTVDPFFGTFGTGLYETCSGDSGGPVLGPAANDADDVVVVGIMIITVKPVGSIACDGTGAIGVNERVATAVPWLRGLVDGLVVANLPVPPPAPTPTPVPPTPEPADTAGDGYWMIDREGRVYAYGDATRIVATGIQAPITSEAVKAVADPFGRGLWILEANGTIHALGNLEHFGDVLLAALRPGERPTTMAPTPTGDGYWVFTDRGRAIAFGAAPHFGDVSDLTLNGPIVDSVALPNGRGYYMVGSDGGIFAFGAAGFHGSMGGLPLNEPINGLVPDPDGTGYWLVAADGGVFAFDAEFRGSMGGTPLNRPINGMVAYGGGYLMVASDGGVFNFSGSAFLGSLGGTPIPAPIIGITPTP